jgi:HAD superfamily hydrolase (TIGR01509 family)
MGNVLVVIDNARKERRLAEVLGLSQARVHQLLDDEGIQYAYEAGQTSTTDFFAQLRAHATQLCSDAALLAAFTDMFAVNAPMVPVLRALKAAGQRLVVVSNTNPGHVAYVHQHFDPFALFDAAVLSHEIKAMKPEPAFYAAALAAAGCPAAEALFIDDLPANVEGARNAGFATHLYEPSAAGHARFVELLRRSLPAFQPGFPPNA